MRVTSGINELLRRLALLTGVLLGVALFCYVVPAVVSVTAVNWEQEQARELKSASGYVSMEKKRLAQLPLNDYIQEKVGASTIVNVDSSQWAEFFAQVELASNGQYGRSVYGNRVSEEDKDQFWKPLGPVAVFFKTDEIPWAQWGLISKDGHEAYVSTTIDAKTVYFRLSYQDYRTSVSAMSKPYRTAPGWLYHPSRNLGVGVLVLGMLLYVFLPRRPKQPEDIAYSAGSMLAGDLAALILLLPFYGLPFLINGGTVQAITGMWPVTAAMWFLACLSVLLLYYNAWHASYRIELTSEAFYLITFKGVREHRFNEIVVVNLVSLRNPGWFRKLFMAVALLSLLGGRTTQPAGSAWLTYTAAYGGLEICGRTGNPLYLWFTNQFGDVIINNFDRLLNALEAAGVQINRELREIEGFSLFM